MDEKITRPIGEKSATAIITALITTVTVTRAVTMPLATGIPGNTAWYTLIISAVWGAAVFSLSCMFMSKFKGQTMDIALKQTLGKFVSNAVLAFFAIVFLLEAMQGVRSLTESVGVYILSDTPPQLLTVVIIAAAGICCARGVEHTARFSYFVRIPMLLMLASIVVIAERNFDYLFPIGGNGIGASLSSSLNTAGAFLPAVAVWFLPRTGFEDARRAGFRSIAYSAVIGAVVLLAYAAAMPVSTVREATPVGEIIGLVSARGSVLPPIYLFMWGGAYLFVIVYFLHFLQKLAGGRLVAVCVILGLFSLVSYQSWLAWALSVRWALYLCPLLAAFAVNIVRNNKRTQKEGGGA